MPTHPEPPTVRPSTGSPLGRRTLLTGAALTVPAIALVASTPAFAASSDVTLSLDVPVPIAAAGGRTVRATVTDRSGQPVAGESVSFTGPSGSSFDPPSATTDASGVATTLADLGAPWTRPGSSVTISAVCRQTSVSAASTVAGANAYGVGYNDAGQLGGGGTGDLSVASQLDLVFPSPIAQIASGRDTTTGSGFSLALLEDGTVWAVGANTSGQLGDGGGNARVRWRQIFELENVTQIAAGSSTGYAVSGGKVFAWGSNTRGQVGDGSTTDRRSPVAVVGLSGVTQVAAGAVTAYAVTSGGVRAWGGNNSGQIGDGSTTVRPTPTTVTGLSNVQQIAAGYISGYALSGGAVKAWGSNTYGQLGDGTTVNRSTAVTVGGLSGVSRIAAGANNAYALVNGTVRAWGRNAEGALGNGTTTDSLVPVTVSNLSNVTQLAAGLASGYVIDGGVVKSWGFGNKGQLGNAAKLTRTAPVVVSAVSNVTRLGVNGMYSLSMFFIR